MIYERMRELLLRYRLGRALVLLVENLDEHHAPVAASAMAFDAFLSLVPLLGLAGYVLHYLKQDKSFVLDPLIASAPEPVKQLLDAEFFRLSDGGAAVVAPVSVAAFLWVSSGGISTAMGVFEAMFKSPARRWWWRRLIAIGAVVALNLLLVVIIAAAYLIASLSGSIGTMLLASVLPLLLVVGMLCGFFRIAITGPRPLRRRLVPGAVVTVLLWGLSSTLFSFYVAKLSRYATLYGSLAAVAIFLFWLWLLMLAVLVGGEVNAQLEGVREDNPLSSRSVRTSTVVAEPPAGEGAVKS